MTRHSSGSRIGPALPLFRGSSWLCLSSQQHPEHLRQLHQQPDSLRMLALPCAQPHNAPPASAAALRILVKPVNRAAVFRMSAAGPGAEGTSAAAPAASAASALTAAQAIDFLTLLQHLKVRCRRTPPCRRAWHAACSSALFPTTLSPPPRPPLADAEAHGVGEARRGWAREHCGPHVPHGADGDAGAGH